MASDVVQFRADHDVLVRLRREGLNPNRVAREAFDAALRRRAAEKQVRRLRRIGAKLPRPAGAMLREERDAR